MSEQSPRSHRYPAAVALAATLAVAGCSVGETSQGSEAPTRPNVSTTVETHTQVFPELAQPNAPIDLMKVRGTEKVTLHEKYSTTNVDYDYFGSVTATDGDLHIAIDGQRGISQGAADQLTRLIHDTSPLLREAFSSQDLTAVYLTQSEGFFDPYFDDKTKSISMMLPVDSAEITEEAFRSLLTHEAVHALIEPVVRGQEPVAEADANLIRSACTALTEQAFATFEHHLQKKPKHLNNLIEFSEGDERVAFQSLKNRAVDGTIGDVAMIRGQQLDMWNVDCRVGDFDNMLREVISASGVQDPSAVYIGMSAYATGANEDYNALTKAWKQAIWGDSLYQKLNESSYMDLPSDKERDYTLGHSQDNANEMLASVVDAALNNPDYVKQLLQSLDETDGQTVRSAIHAAYTIMGHAHPNLQPFLAGSAQQFDIELHWS